MHLPNGNHAPTILAFIKAAAANDSADPLPTATPRQKLQTLCDDVNIFLATLNPALDQAYAAAETDGFKDVSLGVAYSGQEIRGLKETRYAARIEDLPCHTPLGWTSGIDFEIRPQLRISAGGRDVLAVAVCSDRGNYPNGDYAPHREKLSYQARTFDWRPGPAVGDFGKAHILNAYKNDEQARAKIGIAIMVTLENYMPPDTNTRLNALFEEHQLLHTTPTPAGLS